MKELDESINKQLTLIGLICVAVGVGVYYQRIDIALVIAGLGLIFLALWWGLGKLL